MARNLASVAATKGRLPVAVVVADPLPVVRAGLRLLLEARAEIDVLADVGTVEDALAVVEGERRKKIVVLVGLSLGAGNVHDANWLIRTLTERFPWHCVLAMGAHADAREISRALFVGADGFVDKTIRPEEFLAVVRQAADGEAVIATPRRVPIADIVAGIDRRRAIEIALTERERQVLTVAAEGLTAREIADRLGVRERTITTHLARIYGKLGVGNRLAAIRAATRSGLVAAID
jgi:DNA-binding NarL/FixJ family response regulator